MWRRGPHGAGTLCNACGVKWKHGKILQGVTPTTNEPLSSSPAAGDDGAERRMLSNVADAAQSPSATAYPATGSGGHLMDAQDGSGTTSTERIASPGKSVSTPTGESSR
jgi:hypothetical protein